MDFSLIIISFVQGIGELLPISSSVNMFIVQKLLDTSFFNFSFKIALHVGSLIALLIYFRREVFEIFLAIFTKKRAVKDTFLPHLLLATFPVVVLGYLSRDFVKEFNNNSVIGFFCIFFGLLLYVVDKVSLTQKGNKWHQISFLKSFFIGIFQAIAIFPGVSRLGICITASRMLSIDRRKAISFSLLLAIPAISGSLFLEIYKSFREGGSVFGHYSLVGMLITALISAVVIVPCIRFMEKRGFFAIAVYRCLIGIIIWKIDYIIGIFR